MSKASASRWLTWVQVDFNPVNFPTENVWLKKKEAQLAWLVLASLSCRNDIHTSTYQAHD